MEKFECYLSSIFSNYSSSIVIEAMNYALLNPGKRVRSQLFFKALRSLGVKEDFYEVGACIEMIHTYSLIHDDLPCMDNATLRRGKECVHICYPENIAVLAGDGLLTESFNEITKLKIDSNIKVELLKEVVEAAGCKGMIYGQELDLESENKKISEEVLSKIHLHKTGAMIMLPVRVACIIAQRYDLIEKISKSLMKFGLAFQVKDDILDLQDKNIIGKDGDDIVNNKSTYPKLLGIDKSIEYYHTLINESLEMINDLNLDSNDLYEYMKKIVGRTF